MLSNKVKMLLQYKNKMQKDLIDIWKVSSRQALTNKMANERFDFSDIIKLCDFLDYDIEIKDKSTHQTIVTFDISDLKKEQ